MNIWSDPTIRKLAYRKCLLGKPHKQNKTKRTIVTVIENLSMSSGSDTTLASFNFVRWKQTDPYPDSASPTLLYLHLRYHGTSATFCLPFTFHCWHSGFIPPPPRQNKEGAHLAHTNADEYFSHYLLPSFFFRPVPSSPGLV